jgi:hypothetical protein
VIHHFSKYVFILFISVGLNATEHPGLFLTPKGVAEIRTSLGKYPNFDKSVNELRTIADQALTEKIEVPIPKDAGGGYTHEKHKNNYYELNAAGTLYQLSGNKKYAQFVRDMLIKYAEIYPTLGLHPVIKSEARGKLFWQTLNDAVWLVHAANAYDCVYNYISETDRTYIEKNLFKPMAEFLSNGNDSNYETFNKMHNHGTWSLAAVGMIGYVMNDKDLIDKSLYGSKKDSKTGFIRQLDVLFSPDGYYTEGPYYQRYALWPFVTFAQAIQNHQPELKIFAYRDSILQKAVHASLHCAYNGEFFYLNDALPKTYKTQELVYAVDIAYKNNPYQKQLLDIAGKQNAFFVSDAGLITAKALLQNQATPFDFHSVLLHDGQNGDEGGLAILRDGKNKKQTCLTFKATSHGLSHGHYDKLSIVLYDNGNCILPDYGAVRFLNIEPKNGGNYTKENHTWASQTIAHNTVTVDQQSDYDGNIKLSSANHSNILYSEFSNPSIKVVSGSDNKAYKNVGLQRTTALINIKSLEYPVVVDVFRVNSTESHTLDFPFYYYGQEMLTDFNYSKNTSELKALGTKNGYQHLWLEATGKTDNTTACFTFVNGIRFYSITTLANAETELMMTRIGAGDPNFDLRNDPCFMIRQPNATNHTFVSVIEPHGLYDLNREITSGFETNISGIEKLKDNDDFTAVKVLVKNNSSFLFIAVNKDFGEKTKRRIEINGTTISFTGNYYFIEIKN